MCAPCWRGAQRVSETVLPVPALHRGLSRLSRRDVAAQAQEALVKLAPVLREILHIQREAGHVPVRIVGDEEAFSGTVLWLVEARERYLVYAVPVVAVLALRGHHKTPRHQFRVDRLVVVLEPESFPAPVGWTRQEGLQQKRGEKEDCGYRSFSIHRSGILLKL